MDSLDLPKAPRKRSSTSQLGRHLSKRAETEPAAENQQFVGGDLVAVDQQFVGELVAEDGDLGSEDTIVLTEEKVGQEFKRAAKENPPTKYELREVRMRHRLFCCSCQYKTGCKGDQCGKCGHKRCPVCLL
jgi:hypothetical protein